MAEMIPLINEVDHVSHSQLSLWDKCPSAWEYRYVEKIVTPKSCNLVFGDVYHHALEYFYKNRFVSAVDYTPEQIAEIMNDYWDSVTEESEIDWKGEDPDALKDKLKALIEKYIEEVAPIITPVEVERTYYSAIDGVKFILRMDLLEESGAVIDHKTSARSYTQDRIDKDDQATACAFVLGKPIIFYNHVAVKTKNPQIKIYKTFRTQDDIDWWYKKAEKTVKCMRAGLCPPRTDTWYCSPSYCDFYNICRGNLRY